MRNGKMSDMIAGMETRKNRRPVDMASKMFFGQPIVAADLINICIREKIGARKILPEHLTRLDPAHYNVLVEKEGRLKSDNRFRDLMFKCQLADDKTKFIYVGIELQTNKDGNMLERCWEYDLRFYIEQKNDIAGRGSRERIPIVNIVLYLGYDKWETRISLFKKPYDFPKGLLSMCPNYFINVFNMVDLARKSEMADSEEFRVVLNCYRFIKNMKRLEQIIRTGMPLGVYSINAAILINVCLRLKLKLKAENGRVDMCKAMDDLRKDWKKKGEKIGEKRGLEIGEKRGVEIGEKKSLVKIVMKMLREGVPIHDITRFTGSTKAMIREIAASHNLVLN